LSACFRISAKHPKRSEGNSDKKKRRKLQDSGVIFAEDNDRNMEKSLEIYVFQVTVDAPSFWKGHGSTGF